MNPTANMGWGQSQGPGSVCGPNGQLSVVATVWGVTTSTQSAPMGSQGYGSGAHQMAGSGYCGSGSSSAGNAYGAGGGQMPMTKGGSYAYAGGTPRHMGSGYAGGYVSARSLRPLHAMPSHARREMLGRR